MILVFKWQCTGYTNKLVLVLAATLAQVVTMSLRTFDRTPIYPFHLTKVNRHSRVVKRGQESTKGIKCGQVESGLANLGQVGSSEVKFDSAPTINC